MATSRGPLLDLAAEEVPQRRLVRSVAGAVETGQAAECAWGEYLCLDVDLRDLVAQGGDVGPTTLPSERQDTSDTIASVTFANMALHSADLFQL